MQVEARQRSHSAARLDSHIDGPPTVGEGRRGDKASQARNCGTDARVEMPLTKDVEMCNLNLRCRARVAIN
jgi:hypothetical protein